MNDHTARVLRNELNRARHSLELQQREQLELDVKRAQQAEYIQETERSIAELTADLEAAGASTEPWQNPFADTTLSNA